MNSIGEMRMKYEFSFTKHIFMYNHLLTCTDGKNEYTAICESAPVKEETLVFYPDDFGIPPEDKELFVEELKIWAKSHGFKYIINQGKGR